MRDFIGNHLLIVIIIAAVILSGILIYATGSREDLSSVADHLFYPFQVVFQSIQNFFSNISQDVADFRSLQEERDNLEIEMSSLKISQILLDEKRLEVKQLHEALEYYQTEEEDELIFSQVVARNPNSWFDSITIDVGSKDGIQVGMTVIANQDNNIGLVGTIEEVSYNTSKVHLLIDPSKNIAVAAKTYGTILGAEEAFFDGIVEGSFDSLGHLEMIYISHEARIETGSPVLSTGLGGFYVPNIPIGEIIEFNEDAYGLLQTAKVKPHVDFTRLKNVFVVKSPLPQNYQSDHNE
jgi:rod shape-determining protein MreC